MLNMAPFDATLACRFHLSCGRPIDNLTRGSVYAYNSLAWRLPKLPRRQGEKYVSERITTNLTCHGWRQWRGRPFWRGYCETIGELDTGSYLFYGKF
jgi:hypothetical protein